MNGEDAGMDLAAFLLARIGEDEAVAQAAVYSGAWSAVRNEPDLVWEVHCNEWGHMVTTGYVGNHDSKVLAEHMARYDPTRILAECEAKRQIVAEHADINADWVPLFGDAPDDRPPSRCQTCNSDKDPGYLALFPCRTLRLLALPHATHPDYDESWRP